MIEIRNVSKWYGQTQVLNNASTHVAKGEVVVVCGPSGSGKSTLIKCVNGLEPFSQGSTRPSMAFRSATRRPTCRVCGRGSAWCSSTSNCSRT